MSTLLAPSRDIPTVADLLARLGDIPANRVRYFPQPGTATEADVVEIEAREDRLCELVDGVLVEKAIGYRESLLAGWILTSLNEFVLPRKLGLVSGEAGMVRLFPGLVRIPDVAFASRARLPGGRVPVEPVPNLVPELVVEVLSEGNTKAEMVRKRGEYFGAGVQLLWIVDPEDRVVTVFTGREQSRTLGADGVLEGGDVLPGFKLSLRELFARLDG